MMIKLSLFATVALTASIGISQSNTLPKGYDTTPGTANFWAGFDIASSTTTTFKYYVARSLFMYDASTFPWDPKKPKVIDKISFRRSEAYPTTGASTAHKSKWVVILSTSNQPVHRPNTKFDANHGSNKKTVFGAKGAQTVAFLATAQPAKGKTAAFDVTVDITNFLVPANSKTLVVEIRSYSSDVKVGKWRVDCVINSGTGYNGGTYSRFYNTHCIDPKAFYSSRANYLDGNLGHIWRTGRKQGLPVIGIAGTRLKAGIKVPGTTCEWHISPVFYAVGVTSNGPKHATNPGQGGVYLDWGHIPPFASLVGVKVAHQTVIIDPAANKLGLGITRAGESSIGTGYDGKLVKVSAVYSYGAANSLANTNLDPDKETYSRYFYRRVPIMLIK